jgi:hypothetical protein
MIIFLNRKEIYVGFSPEKFYEVLDVLTRNGIQYRYKIITRFHPSEESLHIHWEDVKYSNVYYVYVHKKDYDKACTVLENLKIH